MAFYIGVVVEVGGGAEAVTATTGLSSSGDFSEEGTGRRKGQGE